MSGIDVSTHELAELAVKALGIKVPLDDVLKVWHGLGTVVKTQLTQRKGVRLGALGTFSLTTAGDPTFVMATELASQFKLKFKSQGSPDNIPTTSVNFTQLAQVSDVPREVCEKVYQRFVSCFGRTILEGRDILLSVHRVAEITVSSGSLSCEFRPDFASIFRPSAGGAAPARGSVITSEQKALAAAKAARAMKLLGNAGGPASPAAARGLTPKAVAAKPGSAAGAKLPPPPPREPNNIFGDGSDELSKPPPPRVRNPIIHTEEEGFDFDPFANHKDFKGLKSPPRPTTAASVRSVNTNGTRPSADTLSLLHSPMSRPSSAGSMVQAGGRAVGTGGLRKEMLERQQKMFEREQRTAQQQTRRGGSGNHAGAKGNLGIGLDARAAAAKALDVGDIVQKIRERILARAGSGGIKSMQRLLAIMDDNGDKRLSKDEMKFGLRDYGIDLSPTELDQVFLYFDRDRSGFVDVTEFLVAIRGDLNERRKKFVRMAFNILDTDGSGVINQDEIAAKYDMSWHPDVRSGKKTIKEAVVDFMAQWEREEKDGLVTLSEFEDYYKDISASIDDDDYFELMIRNAWRIAGGEGAAANTANRRVLVTDKNGNQRVETVNQELGMNKKDMKDVKARLAKQGVDAANVDLYGGLDATDKPKAAGGRPSAPASGSGRPTAAAAAAAASAPGAAAARARAAASAPAPSPLPASSRGGGSGGLDEKRSASAGAAARVSAPLSAGAGAFDSFTTLRRLVYDPPVTYDQLGAKLQVSVASTTPRIPMGAFLSRMATLDASLSRAQTQQMWKSLDPNGVGSIELQALYDALATRFGKDKKSGGGSGIIERVIAKIVERAGANGGIKALGRTLAIMDDNGDKRLSKEEMKFGLRDYGIELNIRELDEIFGYFDRDRNGYVTVDEFLIGIRGDLNERRKTLVRMAFDILDTDGSGFITPDEIQAKYDFSQHPDVLSGKLNLRDATVQFMAQWDRGDKDGIVTPEEFEDYYKEVSASIDGDDYFELMIRNAWRIAGGEGVCANTANRRVLVTDKNGNQRVETINQELGMNKKDMNDVKARLAKQGVDAANVDLYGGLDATDKPKAAGGRPSAPASGSGRPTAAAAAARKAPGSPAKPPARDAFTRNMAAVKLAAVFRGRMARKKVAQERRKVDAQQREKAELEAEMNRPKASKLIRPQPKRR